MRLLTNPADANPGPSKLALSLAGTPEEAREVQRLRYKVFIEAAGLSALANPGGLDKDGFDDWCDHLIVRESDSLRVVGTYRVLSPHSARKIGRFYSEQEFDLSRLDDLRGGAWVCGHIHKPEIRDIDGITYCNDGDWVESLSALVEKHSGELRLVTCQEIVTHTKPFHIEADDLCVLPL